MPPVQAGFLLPAFVIGYSPNMPKESAAPKEATKALPPTPPKVVTEQPDPYRLRDLTAQETMAHWAYPMFVVACVSIVITALGAIFVAWQVWLTRAAVRETAKATSAVLEANEMAREAQRPWITMNAVPLFTGPVRDGLNIKINVEFQNIGETIATSVALRTAFLSPGADEVNDDFLKRLKMIVEDWRQRHRMPVNRTLFPHDTITVPHWDNIDAASLAEREFVAGYHGADVIVVAAAIYTIPQNNWLQCSWRAWSIQHRSQGLPVSFVPTRTEMRSEDLFAEPLFVSMWHEEHAAP